jgi:hypothetical protein
MVVAVEAFARADELESALRTGRGGADEQRRGDDQRHTKRLGDTRTHSFALRLWLLTSLGMIVAASEHGKSRSRPDRSERPAHSKKRTVQA